MATVRCMHTPPNARLFVQLAKRATGGPTPAATASSTAPVLDVFAPGWKATTQRCFSSVPRSALSGAVPRSVPNELRGCTAITTAPQSSFSNSRRTFTSTAPRRATTCVRNPAVDEDGKEMFLEITDRAGKRLSQIMKKDANPNLALRIQVESGGCHGFQYLMSLVTLPEPTADSAGAESGLNEDDTIFQYAAESEPAATEAKKGAPKVVIDEPSLELLKGSKVDYTVELIGSQFKIADNPYATSACGCGTSFDIKL